MSNTHVLPPDPARMIEGLRDTGYEFVTAIADIIDNSIAADATLIDIRIGMEFRGEVRVSIADNGIGMDSEGLLNAMKYGSLRRETPASLGKFGLGLKTASTAFCRRLSVVSRPDGVAEVQQATWDLDHVVKESEWQLQLPDPEEVSLAHLDDIAEGHSGTVVTWDNVDRLFHREYKDPGGIHARKALDRKKAELEEHIGMVYQRFLDQDDSRARNIRIQLNGSAVPSWNPYCEGESEIVAHEVVNVELGEDETRKASFTVRAFVLPRKEEFQNEEAWKRARISNEKQGIYIYREHRLIHSADWLGMYQQEPHLSLLRVEFSFLHDMDEAFNVDIKKSRILLSENLWNWMRNEFLPAPRRAAEQRYRKGQKLTVAGKSAGAHDRSNRSIGSKESDVSSAKIDVLDPSEGDVEITNREGKVRLKLKVSKPLKPGQCFVEPVDSIDDGMLWEPCLIDGHKAVRINTGHPYYHKVYAPNLSSGVTVLGMDSLLWALCSAELGTITENSKQHFSEMRFEVSRQLRRLVADLPEPEMEEDDEAA